MRIVFHLLLFDSSERQVLVERVGDRWLAPVLTYDGPSCHQAERLPAGLARLGVTAWPVHEAPVPDPPLGIDHRYCAFIVRTLDTTGRDTWMSTDAALGTPALLDVQRSALTNCLDRFLRPTAKLDSPSLADAPEAWARHVLLARGYTPTGPPRVLRHKRYRRVTTWDTASGSVYLKVNGASVAQEARVTEALGALFPEQFVRTIDADSRRGWWLYEGLAGTPLTHDRLTPELGARLGATVARIQVGSLRSATVRTVLESRRLSVVDLVAVVDLIRHVIQRYELADSDLGSPGLESTWRDVRQACADLGDLPSGFLHGDLWLPNILDRGETIGIIDAERSAWGPVVLSFWPLLELLGADAFRPVVGSLVESYVSVWPRRSRALVERGVQALGVTGRLLQLKAQFDKAGLRQADVARLPMHGASGEWLLERVKKIVAACPVAGTAASI